MFVLVKSISFPLGVWVWILNLIVSIPGLYFLLYLTYNKPKLIFFFLLYFRPECVSDADELPTETFSQVTQTN